MHAYMCVLQVYTVHQESRYLLVQNVSAVGAKDQLAKVFSAYGAISELYPLDDYPAEKFTEVYLIKYQRIQSARYDSSVQFKMVPDLCAWESP